MYVIYAEYTEQPDFEKETADTMEEAQKIKDWYISMGFEPDLITIEEG